MLLRVLDVLVLEEFCDLSLSGVNLNDFNLSSWHLRVLRWILNFVEHFLDSRFFVVKYT